MSSEVKDKDEFALEVTKPKHQQWPGLEEILKHEFLRLVRMRDFLSLILMYPMKMPNQHLLEKWRNEAQAVTTKYFEDIDCVGVKVSGAYHWMHLLSERPLKTMEVLIPNDILCKIEEGQRSIFFQNVSGEVVSSASTSKGGKMLELDNICNVIPEDILYLAADLAVDQLIQTLLTYNIHHVMLSTRNRFEKIDVVRKIEAALNGEYNGTTISNKYSRVLWVDASKYSSNTEAWVRQEIAQQLDLMTVKWNQIENNDILLTGLIEAEMTRMNHLVLLVDGDGQGKVDPLKVGFPKKTLASAVVLLTTESSVLERKLTTVMDLEIRTEDHLMPWELFCRNVGRELVSSSSDIQRIAMQIVKECRGHLLAIVLVAKSLKDIEDVKLWKFSLERLCCDALCGSKISDDMNRIMMNAFTNIRWNDLNNIKMICLGFSLFVLPLEETIADYLLISSWVYNNIASSREEAQLILRDLIHRSIFLQLEGKYIRWSKEIYDILNSLFMLDPMDTIKHGGLELTEPPYTGQWLLASRIELMDNKLSELPPAPKCRKLTELFLQGNANLREIPHLFFHHMPHLLVLDLSRTSIRSLPSSFFNLEELRELYLRGCKRFVELPPAIGQLKKLEILDLESTPITYIPKQIQELTWLKSLILSLYVCDDMMKSRQYLVPPGVISKLTQLCLLRIDVSPVNEKWDVNIQIILQDISGLKELRRLSLYISQAEILKHAPLHRHLDFRYVIGFHTQDRIITRAPPGLEARFKQESRSLRIVNAVNISNNIFTVLQYSNALFLERHRTIKNLYEINIGSLERLQSLIVGECNEMQTLIGGGRLFRPILYWKFLCVFSMYNLISICEVGANFFTLKTIALHNCPNLTVVFRMNFLGSLAKLEELIVEDCPKVSTLISLESFESKEGIFLPTLRKLALLYLPELVNISSGLCIGPNLERIGFYDCPKLQILSAKELSIRDLEVIKGEKEWWDAVKWEVEWGKECCPEHLFSPINEDADILAQLLEDEEFSRSTKKKVENVDENADIYTFYDDKKGDIESLRSNKVTSVENLDEKADLFTGNNGNDDIKSSNPNKQEASVTVITGRKEAKTTDSSVRDDSESSRSSGVTRMKKVVLKLDWKDEKIRQKALKIVAGFPGVESVSVDRKEKEFTLTGDMDPVCIVAKLRKLIHTEIVSVGPVEKLGKKDKGKEKEDNKNRDADVANVVKYYRAYYPYSSSFSENMISNTFQDENVSSCVIS